MTRDRLSPRTLQPTLPAAPEKNGYGPPGSKSPKRLFMGRLTGRQLIIAVVSVLVVGIALALISIIRAPAPPPTVASPPPLTAHGLVQPIARANVATISGGVVEQLPVRVGQMVEAKQPLARIDLLGQTELLIAPWRGTVTALNVRLGDTALPGTVVATVADLSRYQIETTDVDEYLISDIHVGQAATMTVEALEQVQLDGIVRTVSLEQQQSTSGNNYPVVIDLLTPNPALRPGMTVRIRFADGSG